MGEGRAAQRASERASEQVSDQPRVRFSVNGRSAFVLPSASPFPPPCVNGQATGEPRRSQRSLAVSLSMRRAFARPPSVPRFSTVTAVPPLSPLSCARGEAAGRFRLVRCDRTQRTGTAAALVSISAIILHCTCAGPCWSLVASRLTQCASDLRGLRRVSGGAHSLCRFVSAPQHRNGDTGADGRDGRIATAGNGGDTNRE